MKLIRGRQRKARAQKLGPTPDEEYQVLTDEERELSAQIRNLEGFIEEAPQIRERRQQETQVTLPPLEDEIVPEQVVAIEDHDESAGDAERQDLQERYGRRHLEAMRRARRRNFYIFLVSATAVAAFLYWVSEVVQ